MKSVYLRYNESMGFSWAIPVVAGILGAYLINYFSDVLPQSFHLGSPACTNLECKAQISWKDFLLMRRCSKCGKPRNLRTWTIFLLVISASLYLWVKPAQHLGYTLSLISFAYFILVAVIDLEHRLILRPLSIAGGVFATLAGFLMHGWKSMLIGGIAGFMILFAFYLFGTLFTRWRARRLGQDPKDAEEALGSGDVTLATILGLFLGWPLIWFGILLGLLFAGFISLIVILVLLISNRYRQQALMVFIPLGPAFILSTTILVFLPNWITGWLPG